MQNILVLKIAPGSDIVICLKELRILGSQFMFDFFGRPQEVLSFHTFAIGILC